MTQRFKKLTHSCFVNLPCRQAGFVSFMVRILLIRTLINIKSNSEFIILNSELGKMDLQDQLKNLFPEHVSEEKDSEDAPNGAKKPENDLWLQEEPLLCKYEKRKGKPITIIEGYTGAENDFRKLAKELKTTLGVGGSSKNEKITVQGDFRDQIMEILKEKGFAVKRVGG